jgi:hypothetical protein
MTDHRATPEQWANMADAASDGFDDGYGACLLELRTRVEAMEANSKPTPNDRQIRTSLVQRVSRAICYAQQRDETGSRAAIREVNAWLRERAGGTRASWLLDNELEQ